MISSCQEGTCYGRVRTLQNIMIRDLPSDDILYSRAYLEQLERNEAWWKTAECRIRSNAELALSPICGPKSRKSTLFQNTSSWNYIFNIMQAFITVGEVFRCNNSGHCFKRNPRKGEKTGENNVLLTRRRGGNSLLPPPIPPIPPIPPPYHQWPSPTERWYGRTMGWEKWKRTIRKDIENISLSENI